MVKGIFSSGSSSKYSTWLKSLPQVVITIDYMIRIKHFKSTACIVIWNVGQDLSWICGGSVSLLCLWWYSINSVSWLGSEPELGIQVGRRAVAILPLVYFGLMVPRASEMQSSGKKVKREFYQSSTEHSVITFRLYNSITQDLTVARTWWDGTPWRDGMVGHKTLIFFLFFPSPIY